MSDVETTPWSREEFERRLRAKEKYYHVNHEFHVRMHAGELDRPAIQGWVANRFYYQVSIPVKDAALMSNCPDREVRREWVKRIVDHAARAGRRAASRRGCSWGKRSVSPETTSGPMPICCRG